MVIARWEYQPGVPSGLRPVVSALWRATVRDKIEKAASNGRAEAFVTLIAERGIRVEDPAATPGATDDPDDDYLVALARAHRADAIVSGDVHLLAVDSGELPVWTPRALVDRLD